MGCVDSRDILAIREARDAEANAEAEAKQAFRNKWPANARFVSGRRMPDRAYVVIQALFPDKLPQVWLAFETIGEAQECATSLLRPQWVQVCPYVWKHQFHPGIGCWISVVPRQQILDAGFYCEPPPPPPGNSVAATAVTGPLDPDVEGFQVAEEDDDGIHI